MSSRKCIATAVASFGLLAVGARAQAQLITPSSTTYEYMSGTVNTCCGSNANSNEMTRVKTGPSTTFGNGILNNGLFGDQSYLDTTSPGNAGGGSDGWANQMEGGLGASGPDGTGTNTTSFTANSAMYFSTAGTVVFNLGAVYNLTAVNVYGAVDGFTNESQSTGITITGDVSGSAGYTPANIDTGVTNSAGDSRGTYYEDSIAATGVTGQFITIAFAAGNNGFVPLNEIEFTGTAVPEPASLSLLGIGALGLMRRRARRA